MKATKQNIHPHLGLTLEDYETQKFSILDASPGNFCKLG
jgi:hypothetical protein